MKHLQRIYCTIYNYTAYCKLIMHYKFHLCAMFIMCTHKNNFKRQYTHICVTQNTEAYRLHRVYQLLSTGSLTDTFARITIQASVMPAISAVHSIGKYQISNRRNNAFACQIERTYNLIGAYNISRETCGANYIYTRRKNNNATA